MSKTPKELIGSAPDLSSMNVTRRKRGHCDEFTEAFDQFTNKITTMLKDWKLDISSETKGIIESPKKIYDTVNDPKSDVNCIKDEFSAIKKTVSNLSELKLQNRKLRSELNSNDQRDRALIEIVGVPELKDENLTELVLQLGKQTNLDISYTDIVQVNRVSSFSKIQGRPKNIVAKLRTRQQKDHLISQTRKYRLTTANLNIHGKIVPVFVNKHLTMYNKGLLKKAKDMAKSKEYQFTWTKNGRIFVKKGTTSHVIQIEDEKDLQKVI